MAAETVGIELGDTVAAVWGAGSGAQMTTQSPWMQEAGRVIANNRVPERLALDANMGRAETINFDNEHVKKRLIRWDD